MTGTTGTVSTDFGGESLAVFSFIEQGLFEQARQPERYFRYCRYQQQHCNHLWNRNHLPD